MSTLSSLRASWQRADFRICIFSMGSFWDTAAAGSKERMRLFSTGHEKSADGADPHSGVMLFTRKGFIFSATLVCLASDFDSSAHEAEMVPHIFAGICILPNNWFPNIPDPASGQVCMGSYAEHLFHHRRDVQEVAYNSQCLPAPCAENNVP